MHRRSRVFELQRTPQRLLPFLSTTAPFIWTQLAVGSIPIQITAPLNYLTTLQFSPPKQQQSYWPPTKDYGPTDRTSFFPTVPVSWPHWNTAPPKIPTSSSLTPFLHPRQSFSAGSLVIPEFVETRKPIVWPTEVD
ncbi:uncharacterized protein LOC125769697 [Anopheles funestus]|uniref:uncharacterized protein LOC125769697 n=1 Tax=Anopheles funestus TaxID=62324 RepID=UPI0020C5F470|nr:uncharacterized protein LOC125769697 [Anopheles funestus]